MGAWLLVLIALYANQPSVQGKSLILKSPVDQDVGKWGSWDDCPNNTYASGFQMKYQFTKTRFGKVGDETYINGIRLFCSSIGQNNWASKTPSSLVGDEGEWRGEIYCDGGSIIGFQFKSEPYKGGQDDTAGNNLKVLCVLSTGKQVWIEGDGETRFAAARYTAKQVCKPQQAIRAIRTQVDVDKKGNGDGDKLGLVNFEMRCDDVILPEQICKPNTNFDLLLECNNINGKSTLDCKYTSKEGVSKDETASSGTSQEQETLTTLGFTASASYSFVEASVSHEKTWAQNFGESTMELSSDFWISESTRIVALPIPPKAVARVFQLTSSCGGFRVGSPEFVISSRNGDLPNPIPPKGFVCTKPQEFTSTQRKNGSFFIKHKQPIFKNK